MIRTYSVSKTTVKKISELVEMGVAPSNSAVLRLAVDRMHRIAKQRVARNKKVKQEQGQK